MPVLALPPKNIPFETQPLLEGVALQQPPALQCCPPPQLRVAGPCWQGSRAAPRSSAGSPGPLWDQAPCQSGRCTKPNDGTPSPASPSTACTGRFHGISSLNWSLLFATAEHGSVPTSPCYRESNRSSSAKARVVLYLPPPVMPDRQPGAKGPGKLLPPGAHRVHAGPPYIHTGTTPYPAPCMFPTNAKKKTKIPLALSVHLPVNGPASTQP